MERKIVAIGGEQNGRIKSLGFVDGLFVPHCEEQGRYESVKELLSKNILKER